LLFHEKLFFAPPIHKKFRAVHRRRVSLPLLPSFAADTNAPTAPSTGTRIRVARHQFADARRSARPPVVETPGFKMGTATAPAAIR